MSVNRHRPHLIVLPEDHANHQLARGFQSDPGIAARNIQILTPVGGWAKVRDHFQSSHIRRLDDRPKACMVLVIDCDGRPNRLDEVRATVPEHLLARVFVLGVLSEPEQLKAKLGKTFDTIGAELARDCLEGTREAWNHELLKHNLPEVARMREAVASFLFTTP